MLGESNHKSFNDKTLACCGFGSGVIHKVLASFGPNNISLSLSYPDEVVQSFMFSSLPLRVYYCEQNLQHLRIAITVQNSCENLAYIPNFFEYVTLFYQFLSDPDSLFSIPLPSLIIQSVKEYIRKEIALAEDSNKHVSCIIWKLYLSGVETKYQHKRKTEHILSVFHFHLSQEQAFHIVV